MDLPHSGCVLTKTLSGLHIYKLKPVIQQILKYCIITGSIYTSTGNIHSKFPAAAWWHLDTVSSDAGTSGEEPSECVADLVTAAPCPATASPSAPTAPSAPSVPSAPPAPHHSVENHAGNHSPISFQLCFFSFITPPILECHSSSHSFSATLVPPSAHHCHPTLAYAAKRATARMKTPFWSNLSSPWSNLATRRQLYPKDPFPLNMIYCNFSLPPF